MSRSSDEQAQTEPLGALVAVVVVTSALGLYAGVLDTELPGQRDRAVTETTLESVSDRIAPDGVVVPARVDDGPDAGPAGYTTHVTVATDDHQWSAGPTPPRSVDSATGRVSVRVAPATVVPGIIEVEVWQ